jgi:hypothetical protein
VQNANGTNKYRNAGQHDATSAPATSLTPYTL